MGDIQTGHIIGKRVRTELQSLPLGRLCMLNEGKHIDTNISDSLEYYFAMKKIRSVDHDMARIFVHNANQTVHLEVDSMSIIIP